MTRQLPIMLYRWLTALVALAGALALAATLALSQQTPQTQPAPQPQQAQQAQPAPQAQQTPPTPQPQQAQQAQPAPQAQQTSPTPPTPQAPDISKAGRTLDQLRGELDAIRKEIAVPTIPPDKLAQQRQAADAIRIEALAAQADIRKPLEDFTAQLKKLGEPPAEGATEAPAVAAERKRLGDTLGLLEGTSKQLGLVAVEADQVASGAANLQRDLFIRRVFEPSRSVLNPALWYEVAAALPSFAQRTGILVSGALASDASAKRFLSPGSSLALGGFAALLFILVAWRLNVRFTRQGSTSTNNNLPRLWRAVWVTVFTIGLLVAGFIVAHLIANLTGGIGPRLTRVLIAGEKGTVWLSGALALAWGVLAPRNPAWRLVNVDDNTAGRMVGIITVIAFVFSADHVVSTMANVLFLPFDFTVGWSAAVAVVLAVSIGMLLRASRANTEDEGEREGERQYFFGWTAYLVQILWLFVVAAAIALIFGYVAFAHFVMTKLIDTAAIVSLLYLLHHLVDAVVSASLDTRTAPGRFLRTTLSLGETGARRLGLFFSTLVDLALVLGGIPLIMAQWAVTWIDYSSWMQTVFFGFKVGNITIDPANILLALAILVFGIIATRLLRLWLDWRLLSRTRMDAGLRNSILTASSYASILLAASIAVTAAGVDFSNLAIIVGALSVGIGLGLQSIVNNFVSGLILLAERPIRVGDWISVTGGEGTVKRINVRSTELETFDRGSVIIPNSSLISEAVLNWTHTDALGRARIAVGVTYDADPEQVEKILLECARANERVLSFPKPFVLFMAFGDSSLDFELRVYIPDVNYVAIVGSDLRFAIFKALKEAGIEIPFPQRDVHVKSLPENAGPCPPTAREPKT